MPNLIHSLDATSLSLLIAIFMPNNNDKSDSKINSVYENTNKNFYSVHDCFAVTANNVANLICNLKLVYIQLYSENKYILDFDKSIIRTFKLSYGENNFKDDTRTYYFENKWYKFPDVTKVIAGEIDPKLIKESQYLIN